MLDNVKVTSVLRNLFDNVKKSDEELLILANEILIDIQVQANPFKRIISFDLLDEERDPVTNEIIRKKKYDYNLKVILEQGVSTEIVTNTFFPGSDQFNTDIEAGEFVLPEHKEHLRDTKIKALNVLECLNIDYGELPNKIIAGDWLKLSKEFDFKTYKQALVYGSVIYYDISELSDLNYMRIKNALYWGVLNRLHASVSNINAFQMENLYYQRYYSAIQELIRNNGGLNSVEEYNNNIMNFV